MDAAWEQAVRCGDAEAVRTLLAQGTDIDSRDRYGQTALMLAAHAGQREIVETLIAHHANLNVTAKFGLPAMKRLPSCLHRPVPTCRCAGAAHPDSRTRRPMILPSNATCRSW